MKKLISLIQRILKRKPAKPVIEPEYTGYKHIDYR